MGAEHMLDTSKWPTIELDVLKEVHLDPKNVRLEIADAKVEADIIEDLFVRAKQLADSGAHREAIEAILDQVAALRDGLDS